MKGQQKEQQRMKVHWLMKEGLRHFKEWKWQRRLRER